MAENITRKDLAIKKEDGSIISRVTLNKFCRERTISKKSLNAFITLSSENKIYELSEKADKEISDGKKKPLTGIPIAVKDNMCTSGQKTTCASRILSNFVPAYDATVVRKIKEAGATITGKTNMDEFAMGSSNENSYFGPAKNPWNHDHVPGGSSGGSAIAVGAGLAAASLGSDTGGSVRQPCSFCGVVGMKPTYGRVSRFGLIAFASSFDQIGPITNSIRDNAILLKVISGDDPLDETSSNIPVPDYEEFLEKDISGIKIGLPKEYFPETLHPEIRKYVKNSITILKKMGVEFIDISLPKTEYAIPCYYVIAPSEASSNLARFDGVKYGFRADEYDNLQEMYQKTRSSGFGDEVKRRIMLGTHTLSSGYYDAYYLKALKVRQLITNEFTDTFKKVDAILSPVTPNLPFKFGEKTKSPIEMYLSDIYTVSVNLAGLPALSMPCGFAEGFPIGVQLIGNHFNEELLYRIGYGLERELNLNFKLP